MKTELVHGLPFAEYLAWPALSRSAIMIGLRASMMHVKAAMDGHFKTKMTDDMAFGQAFHCYLLEGHEAFDSRFKIRQPCEARLKSGDRKGQPCSNDASHLDATNRWLCGVHGKGLPFVTATITEEEFARMRAMARALARQDVIRVWRARSWSECSVCCDLAFAGAPGVYGKARIDRMIETEPRIMVDLKKIQPSRGSHDALRRDIREYGYDVQAAWYSELYREATGFTCAYLWIFMEDDEPFDVRIVQATPDMIGLGRRKYSLIVHRWRECCEQKRWPGYSDGIDTYLQPEPWELKQWGMGE